MTATQRTVFGSNHTTEIHRASPVLTILALGISGACFAFAIVVGTRIAGTIGTALLVLTCTTAACLALTTGVRQVLHVINYRRTGQLPPAVSLVTINRPLPLAELPQPRPQMTVTRADYADRRYPEEL